MAKFSPHYEPHKITALVRSINDWIFWIIFGLALITLIFKKQCETENIKELLDILNMISISIFFVLEMVVEFILFPLSEQTRRDDFLDNSFGSKFSSQNSEDYYSNDLVKQGLFKASCNLFENVFFTYSLAKALTIHRIVFPVVVLLSVGILAYFGFSKVPIALTILQVLFSANVLGNLIKHFIFLNRTYAIYQDWISLFQFSDLKTNTLTYQPHIYKNWLNYETILSRIQPGIPEKIFKKHNSNLTAQWNCMKSKYLIN